MKKITIELHTGAAMNEDTLKKYLKSLELSERALISVESEPASTYTLHDTNLIAFPINSRIIGSHITHGSILYYGETEEYDIGNDMTSYQNVRYTVDTIGRENVYESRHFITINSDVIKSGRHIVDRFQLNSAFKVRNIAGEHHTGIIELLTAQEIFELGTRNTPIEDTCHVPSLIRKIDDGVEIREQNGIDPAPICHELMDLYCGYLEANKEGVTGELIEHCLKELCSMTSKVDLSAYIERLFDLVEDKKRLLYSTVSHLSTSHTYRDPLRFVRKKDYIIKMMYCAGFVTALEVEAAREIYNKGETEWTGLDYAKSYILSAYLSFAVRDNRTFNRPKYATDYFEFSYYLVKQANGVVNSTYSRYEFESANVEDVVAAHYDTVFKPLLVNLFNTQTKDPTIFRTYTTEVVRVFNSLYYIFNEPKMASDFTNTIALNIENQTPKTVERNIDDIYDWVAPKVQKGLMFNDCGSCKKVKQAVMIKKLGK